VSYLNYLYAHLGLGAFLLALFLWSKPRPPTLLEFAVAGAKTRPDAWQRAHRRYRRKRIIRYVVFWVLLTVWVYALTYLILQIWWPVGTTK
jgi:hypothetical protein